jgi:hypothetical protein
VDNNKYKKNFRKAHVLKSLKKFTVGSLILASTGIFGSSVVRPMTGFLSRDLDVKPNKVQGFIGALSNQASEKVGNVPGNRYRGEFEFLYQKLPSTYETKLESKFHAAAQINDQSLTMYSLQEAYVGGNLTNKDQLRVGRQILPWSAVDQVWGFGKLNNRRNFDYFTPEQEGLVGVFYERKSSNGLRYRVFGSGIYVPEMNPPLDIDKNNQTISSRHPWADAPATTANVDGVLMDVKYDVDYPDLKDVIYRYSVGFNLGYESKHWVMDNFFIRKPENTITPDVEVNVDFISNAINASIDPRFYYHDVYGSTLKYRNKDVEIYFSGIAIRPNEFPDVDEQVRYTEIKNKKRREDYVGGGISKTNDLYTMAFNYVARLSPFDREKDDLAPDPRWNQAVNILLGRNFGRSIMLQTDIKYDMLTTDRLVMFRGVYKASQNLHVNAGINMIGTPTEGNSFWAPYTNNDAIYGGLRYVF